MRLFVLIGTPYEYNILIRHIVALKENDKPNRQSFM